MDTNSPSSSGYRRCRMPNLPAAETNSVSLIWHHSPEWPSATFWQTDYIEPSLSRQRQHRVHGALILDMDFSVSHTCFCQDHHCRYTKMTVHHLCISGIIVSNQESNNHSLNSKGSLVMAPCSLNLPVILCFPPSDISWLDRTVLWSFEDSVTMSARWHTLWSWGSLLHETHVVYISDH